MKACHGCNSTGKMQTGSIEIDCAICGGKGQIPDTYSIDIAKNYPHLCPACGRSRSEPALDDCPPDNHYAQDCPA